MVSDSKDACIAIYLKSNGCIQHSCSTVAGMSGAAIFIDKGAENANKPGEDASDQNRTLDEAGEWLVMLGVCTHLGCVPLGAGEGEVKGEFGGYFCPCHKSRFDMAGRVFKNKPSPDNLPVPPHMYLSDTKLLIGEDKKA